MLKKTRGFIRVDKLRLLLLLKVDFNGMNKIYYNTRVLSKLERRQLILYEIIERRRG